MKTKTTFGWRNYFAPTPKNLERISGGLRHIFTVVTGANVLIDTPHWITIGILIVGASLDEATKFFGLVSQDGQSEAVDVEFKDGEEITILKPIKEEDKV